MVRIDKFPFYAGEDIKEGELAEYFCDRDQETKEIVNYLSAQTKQHIALVGKRRIGKSSLMIRCKSELEKNGIPTVFIRVEKVFPFNHGNLFSYILKEIEKACERSPTKHLRRPGKKLAKYFKPKKIGIDFAKTISLWAEYGIDEKDEDLPKLIEQTFNAIDQVGQQSGKIVIMLDEFQRFFEFGSDFLWALRGQILDLKSASFVVSSSLTSFGEEITRNKKQPFFNFFIPITIKELPEKEVRMFVKERFKKFRMIMPEDALDFFINRSVCHPFYVQQLGRKCYEITKSYDLDTVNKEIVQRAYEDLIDLLPHHLTPEFEKLTGKSKEIVVAMATKDLERPIYIAKELKINDRSISAFLRKIENRHGIIERVERGRYKFTDNFLREWIKRNHSIQEESTSVRIEEEEPFNSELVDNYIDFLRTEKLSFENVSRLLQSIRQEALKIYRKRGVNKEDIRSIKNLIAFASDFIKDKDKEIIERIFDILSLLTRIPETLQLIKETCYGYLKELYENGEHYKDLMQILDACGYFGERIDEIMMAIDERDKKKFDILTSKLEISEFKERKYEIIKQLILKMEHLNPEKDKNLIEMVDNLRRQFEIA